jgi:hypothetical protein
MVAGADAAGSRPVRRLAGRVRGRSVHAKAAVRLRPSAGALIEVRKRPGWTPAMAERDGYSDAARAVQRLLRVATTSDAAGGSSGLHIAVTGAMSGVSSAAAPRAFFRRFVSSWI